MFFDVFEKAGLADLGRIWKLASGPQGPKDPRSYPSHAPPWPRLAVLLSVRRPPPPFRGSKNLTFSNVFGPWAALGLRRLAAAPPASPWNPQDTPRAPRDLPRAPPNPPKVALAPPRRPPSLYEGPLGTSRMRPARLETLSEPATRQKNVGKAKVF